MDTTIRTPLTPSATLAASSSDENLPKQLSVRPKVCGANTDTAYPSRRYHDSFPVRERRDTAIYLFRRHSSLPPSFIRERVVFPTELRLINAILTYLIPLAGHVTV
ncbi:hypothetical protein CHS0354_033092 [Potamilus streckersoni]|uniref:Uncharacterized protein n=1 Tax=Potamilus streckersoni TaxID=2493646 RepID=A0AAE0VL01_9BIVA|nr:hypothetical protein CHS0354_033092 [Potamilus streckersoni]